MLSAHGGLEFRMDRSDNEAKRKASVTGMVGVITAGCGRRGVPLPHACSRGLLGIALRSSIPNCLRTTDAAPPRRLPPIALHYS